MNNALPKLWSLPGGIHPPENKSQSLNGPIRMAALPPQLTVPVTQPDYATPQLCVQVGDRVHKGQALVRAAQSSGLLAHAPAAGVVSAIAGYAIPNASGLPELCVVIDTDPTDTRWAKLKALDYPAAGIDTLIERIADAGISGLGGAGFPTQLKLRSALQQVDTLVLNAAECEPFITADAALLCERAADVVTGGLILLQITGAGRCLIGIEDNKPQAIAALQQHCSDARLQVVVIPARYPSGAENQLIHILTGTEIPSGTLAVHSGILCHNVGTAYAIARAVVHGEQLLSRITTVSGAALREPANYEVLTGTPVAALLQHSGVDHTQLSRLLCGGPLMGIELPHAQLPVTKTTNCVVATTEAELPSPPPAQACIRCGLCVDVCPVQLLPQQLYWFARSKEYTKAQAHNLQDCIECGACAYVCPSHIPLVQYYRNAKAGIREQSDKHQRADYAKQRFEVHQQRVALEQAQNDQRRAERAAAVKAQPAAAAGTSAQDAIAAALARVQAKKAAQSIDAGKQGDSK